MAQQLRVTSNMRTFAATRVAILATLTLGATGCEDEFVVTPLYNHANGRVVIEMNRDLEGSEQLFTRARRGSFGKLDCTKLAKRDRGGRRHLDVERPHRRPGGRPRR